MTRIVSSGVLLALTMIGCGASVEFVPLEEDRATTILASRAPDAAAWEIRFRALHDDAWSSSENIPSAPTTETIPADQEALLLLYDESPEALGLRGASETSCRVLQPEARRALAQRNGEWTWQEITELPSSLLDALVGSPLRCDPCAPMQIDGLTADSTLQFRGAAWFDESSAITLNEDGLWRVTREQITPLPRCDGLTETPHAIAAAGDGRFWIGGAMSELARVHISLSGCVVETSTQAAALPGAAGPPGRFVAVAARPGDEAAHDLLALRESGEFFRWDAAGLRHLGTLEPHPSRPAEAYPTLLRLDPTRTVASIGWDHVYFWEGDSLVRTESVPLNAPTTSARPRDRITSLDHDRSSDRLLAGTAYGEVFSRPLDAPTWSSFLQSTVADEIGAVRRSHVRYLVIHAGGDLTFLHGEGGLCSSPLRFPLASRSAPHRIVLERDGSWLIGDVNGSQGLRPATVSWLSELWTPRAQ